MSLDARRATGPDAPFVPPCCELLEPRLLLDAAVLDWTGTWSVRGYEMEADTDYNRAWWDTGRTTMPIHVVDQGGGQYLVHPGEPDQGVLMQLDGDGNLSGSKTGYDEDGDYFEAHAVFVGIEANAALLLYGEGGWDSPDKNDLWWGFGLGGLGTRGKVNIPAVASWEGIYDIEEWEVEVDTNWGDGVVEFRHHQDRAFITDLGGGAYAAGSLDELDDEPTIFTRRGRNLEQHGVEEEDGGVICEYDEWLLPGPNGSFYFIGGEAGFDSEARTDLYWSGFWLGVATPRNVAADGAVLFGADSATFTNPWLGLTEVGDGYQLEGTGAFAGATRSFSLVGTGTLAGVDCQILHVNGHGEDPSDEYYNVWLAQDRQGNLRALRFTGFFDEGIVDFWQPASAAEAPIFLPAAPSAGQVLWADENWVEAVGETVGVLDTGLGPYNGCAVLASTEVGEDWLDYAYHAPGVGVVYEEWTEGGALIGTWQRSVSEPLVMDWTGDWNLNRTLADTEWLGGIYGLQEEVRRETLHIRRLANGRYYGWMDDVNQGKLLDAHGDEIRADGEERLDDGSYGESYLRFTAVDQDVALLLFGEAHFSNENRDDLWGVYTDSGLASKGRLDATPRPWAGTYDIDRLLFSADDLTGSAGLTEETLVGHIVGAGGAHYDLIVPADPSANLRWRETGGRLVHDWRDLNAGGTHWWRSEVYRGPNDTLYWYGYELVVGNGGTDVRYGESFVATLAPQPGSQYLPDLTAEVDGSRLPEWVLPGDRRNGRLQATVLVTNQGNVDADGVVTINLYASSDETLDAGDTLLASDGSARIRLRPGQTRPYRFNLRDLPAIPAGSYYILADVDSENRIAETNTGNNVAASADPVEWQDAFVDLSAELDGSRLPEWVLPGDRRNGRLQATVLVTNQGNVDADGVVTINLYASSDETLDAGDTLLASDENARIRLRPGQTRPYRFNLRDLPAGPVGPCYILAVVDATNTIAESQEDNNVGVSASTVEWQEAQRDLTAVIDGSRLPEWVLPGDRRNGRLQTAVLVTNQGNVDAFGTVVINLYASDDQTLDAGDTLLASDENARIRLRPGQTRPYRFNLRDVPVLPAGDYHILAEVDCEDQIGQTNTNNDVGASASTVEWQNAFVDLLAEVEPRLRGDTYAGDGGLARIAIGNEGNVPASGLVDVKLYVSDDDQLDPSDPQVAALAGKRVNLMPGRQVRANLPFVLPDDLKGGMVHLLAEVTPAEGIVDADASNNVAASDAWRLYELIGLETLRLYDQAPMSWTYTVTDTTGPDAPEVAEAVVEIDALGGDRYQATTYFDGEQASRFDYVIDEDGTHLQAGSLLPGLEQLNLDLDPIAGLDVSPALFKPTDRRRFTDSAPIHGTFEADTFYGAVEGTVDGVVTTKFRMLGQDDVALASGQAYEGAWQFETITMLQGRIEMEVDGRRFRSGVRSQVKMTAWAVEGVGIVRMDQAVIASAAGARMRTSVRADLAGVN